MIYHLNNRIIYIIIYILYYYIYLTLTRVFSKRWCFFLLKTENGENVYSYSMDMEKPYDWHCNVDIYSLYGHRKVIAIINQNPVHISGEN
jgi:hypothetical protein